jgi:hypothetical protein
LTDQKTETATNGHETARSVLSADDLRELLALKNREIAELERMVTMYQSEGEDECPEEVEYAALVAIPKQKRTAEQRERLKILAVLIVDLCCSDRLRQAVKLAWQADRTVCPVCQVNLVTDFHLPTCALGLIVSR